MLNLLRKLAKIATVVATVAEMVLVALGSRRDDSPPPSS